MATVKVSVRLVPFGRYTLEHSYKAAEQPSEPDKTLEASAQPALPTETISPMEPPIVYGLPVVTFE